MSQTSRVGALIDGEYRIDGVLGRGGMGTVYRATWLNGPPDGAQVAVKVLSEAAVDDEKTATRFRREGETLARLEHANILRMHKLAVDGGGWPYLVTELIEGQSLRTLLAADWPLSPRRLHGITMQLCLGLGYAHAVAGVVHRDIKPDNVLLTRDDRVKIVDFGISKCLNEERTALTAANAVLGTPAYIAPEQIAGAPLSFRADLYALGAMLYECLTGQAPFAGRGYSVKDIVLAHLQRQPAWPAVDGHRLEGPLVELTMQCLAKSPMDRPRSANTLVDMLSEMDAETCVTGYPADGEEPPTVMLKADPRPQDGGRQTRVLEQEAPKLPRATVTSTRAAFADNDADPRQFQRVPLAEFDLIKRLPDPSLSQVLEAGYMQRAPTAAWMKEDITVVPPSPPRTLAEDAEALARQQTTAQTDPLRRRLLAAVAVAAMVLIAVVVALITNGCDAPDASATQNRYGAPVTTHPAGPHLQEGPP